MSGNENLAGLSNLLMVSALLVYAGAFVAYCAEWTASVRSRSTGRRRPRLPLVPRR